MALSMLLLLNQKINPRAVELSKKCSTPWRGAFPISLQDAGYN
ncbi:MAG: hypothetical protein WA828_04180 [Coleofasciculaceae cyanobacterium]